MVMAALLTRDCVSWDSLFQAFRSCVRTVRRDVSRKKKQWGGGVGVKARESLYPMIGRFWQLLSALGGSLRWLEMWFVSNAISHQFILHDAWWSDSKETKVMWNIILENRKKRFEAGFRYWKVGPWKFTIYWLLTSLFLSLLFRSRYYTE